MTDRTPIIAPGTLPGRARATRKAHDRRTRLARESRAANPAGRARPETASRDEYRVLRSKPSNISLTPQSTRLDLPLVPPRQRPGHTQPHIHRQRRLTEHPPYQIRHEHNAAPAALRSGVAASCSPRIARPRWPSARRPSDHEKRAASTPAVLNGVASSRLRRSRLRRAASAGDESCSADVAPSHASLKRSCRSFDGEVHKHQLEKPTRSSAS